MTQDHQPAIYEDQQRPEDKPCPEDKQRRKEEWRMFIFIIVFLFPILSVAIVGGYGFSIWMYQLFAGPPGGGGDF